VEPELGDDPIGMKQGRRTHRCRARRRSRRTRAVSPHKLSEGLRRSSSRLADGLAGLAKRKIDRDSLDELEELLITSDMGAKVAARIAKAFSKDRFDREVSGDEIKAALASEIAAILKPREKVVDFSEGPNRASCCSWASTVPARRPRSARSPSKLSAQGATSLLAAGDTFRAAAVEQLKVWANAPNAGFISKPHGADAAGLAYEAVETGEERRTAISC
jgi:fused signal recognition particle receptor